MHEHEVISEIKTIRVYAGDEKEIIPVANKIDLSNEALINNFTAIPETVFISAQEKTGIEDLLSRISKWTDQRSHLGDENIVTNARHAEALANASVNLKRVLDGLTSSLPGDLLAIDIRAALSALSAITGEVSSDEVLGAIFGKFCIGK
jgi:tRNA modification GTPase